MLRTSLIAIVLTTGQASAASIWMEGTVDCGMWVAARTSHRAEMVESFALGQISGMAFGAGIEVWQANGSKMSREQFYLWLDKYCRDNPLKDVLIGTIALFNERTNNGWNNRRQ